MVSHARTAVALLLVAFCLLISELPASSAGGGTITGSVAATPQKYLGETVVHLENVPGQYPPKTVSMDQVHMNFVPHVLAITVGDTVDFLNHDVVPHNVFSPEGHYNLGSWQPGESRSHEFDRAGAFSQLCALHPEMLAYVYVNQNPYQAVVDSSGQFKIADVPPGTYVMAVWNSHLNAPSQRITVTAGGTARMHFDLHR